MSRGRSVSGEPPLHGTEWAPGYASYRILVSHCFFLHMRWQETFETLKSWISELRQHGPVNIVLAVAGNKCDLEDLRQVQYKGK